jgi:hypothetical protein
MKTRVTMAMLAVATVLCAHHSFAADYDINKPVCLTGVIEKFAFINPHAEIYLDVNGTQWWIEAASPHALQRRGISKVSMPEGTRVIIQGFRAKNGSNKAIGRAVVLPGGRKILLDASGAQ